MLVVDPQDRLQIGQQIALGQKLADDVAQQRGTPQPTADQHPKADLASLVAGQIQADIVDLSGGAVVTGAGDGDLELARQVGKFRVKGGPLADDFAIDPRVFDFIRGHPGQVIGGNVANAVAAGLDGVHLRLGQFGEDVRGLFQFGPVVLNVLAGGEMAKTPVVAAGDMGQHP